ncbi:MAG TPA: SbmA/BacA-like family transporter [Xanthobacteraceae bacterium]|nr:SbmA/BacA-like family transporter [Xanthobacteraceae bacterium]
MRPAPKPVSLNHNHLLHRFWKSSAQICRANLLRVAGLGGFLLAVVLLQLSLQVLLNLWNRYFFDALERHDVQTVWTQAQLFVPLAAASILLAAASVWGRMTTQRNWRRMLTHQVVERWLTKNRFAEIDKYVKGTENPEYRIAVDIRVATDAPVDLALAFLSSVLTAITFFGVLWEVGGSLDIVLFGRTLTIPGHLVIGVIVYSGTMSALMVFVGHHLTGVIEQMNQSEAEFRAAVDAFRAEKQPGDAADGDAARNLWLRLQAALLWWRELCWQLVRTTLVSYGNLLLAPVVAWFLCVPKYLNGTMTLGQLTQTAAAFVTVQGAFNWLVDNYGRMADWRASAHRVATVMIALDEAEARESASRLRNKNHIRNKPNH